MFAVVSRLDRNCGERLLQLGMSGVQSLVDLSRRDGWLQLRSVVGLCGTRIGSRVISAILSALGTTTPGTRRFFEALVTLAPTTLTARKFAARLQVPASTFTSRFFRAALPSPKRYLSAARLVHSAALLEMRGLSLSDVAYRLDFSSPQSFSRHVKSTTGMTAGEFRERLNFRSALNDFTSRLILPFRVTFRTFHPFDHGMGDLGHRR